MSKLYFILTTAVFAGSFCLGQNTASIDTIKPEFGSGDTTLEKFVAANTNYPEGARKNCLRGKVTIGFKISSLGNLEELVILKNSFKPLDEEAIRVIVSTKGKWKPATVNGTPIDYYMNLPFNFWFDDYKCDEVLRNNEAMFKLKEWMEKARLLYESGTQKLNNKEYEEALKDFDESIKINSVDKDVLYNRAVCRLKLGDKEGACEDWKKSKKNSNAKEREEINQLLVKYCK